MATKIVTYSFDDLTLDKIEKLTKWMRLTNKSQLLRTLVDKEYSARFPKDDDQEVA